jgi:HK97 family phage major capsid protein
MTDETRKLRAARERAVEARDEATRLLAAADRERRGLTPAERAKVDSLESEIASAEREADDIERRHGIGKHSRPETAEQRELDDLAAESAVMQILRAGGTQPLSGRVLEQHQELVRRGYKPARGGTLVPLSALGRERRGLTVASGPSGGYLVPENFGEFIAPLREATFAGRAGAMMIDAQPGDLVLPKQTGTATASWLQEGGSLAPSDPSFGQVRLTPKALGASVVYSRQLAASSSPEVARVVEDDLIAVLSRAVDRAVLYGAGNGSEPQGLLGMTGVGAPAEFASATPTWSELLTVVQAVAGANALTPTARWVMNPSMTVALRGATVDSGSGTFCVQGVPPTCAGFGVVESGLVAHAAGSATEVWLGDWSQLVIATWAGLELIVDPFTLASTAQVKLSAFMLVDVGVRHPEAFARGFYSA